MWAHISGSLIDWWGFWIRPSPVVICRDNYSASSCFAFCDVGPLLWGWPGSCALLEAISLHWTLIVRNGLLSRVWKADSAEPWLDPDTHSFHTQNQNKTLLHVTAKQSTHLCLFIWIWEYALWDFLLKTSCVVCCFQGFRVHTQEIKS